MKVAEAALAVAASLWLSGCVQVDPGKGEMRSESRTVPLDGSEMVRAEVKMGAGELELRSGAEQLMEADFQYTAPFIKPEIRYEATGFRGRLTVRQGGDVQSISGDITNEWKLKLSPKAPIDLAVFFGAGECNLLLSGLQLRSLEVEMGAGELNLDLTGDWKRSFDVRVRGGVGEANVKLPREVGIVAEAKGGIGEINTPGLRRHGNEFVNDAYGKSPVTIRLDVKGGVGEINLIGAE